MLVIGSWTGASSIRSKVEVRIQRAVKKLRNNSADGYFNIPESDLCEWNYM